MATSEDPATPVEGPLIGTSVSLEGDGLVSHFDDDATRAPVLAATDQPGIYDLTIVYHPRNGESLLGAPVTTFGRYGQIRTHYAKVLGSQGLEFLGVKTVVLEVNNHTLVASDDLADQGDGVFDMRPQFLRAADLMRQLGMTGSS